ncbi:hypothetical protein ACSFA8_22845 [Variovorax sp. RT4R15]|uniref:hypothetical protein n=1 Tax=Variovorax sp. RT4R15 TaxID=3443737 RepID=UPI003F460FEB
MLTTDQKETILRRAGIAIPGIPAPGGDAQLQQADGELLVKGNLQADSRASASEQRTRAIDALFADYSARRAAKSLDDAEAARRTGGRGIGWGGFVA